MNSARRKFLKIQQVPFCSKINIELFQYSCDLRSGFGSYQSEELEHQGSSGLLAKPSSIQRLPPSRKAYDWALHVIAYSYLPIAMLVQINSKTQNLEPDKGIKLAQHYQLKVLRFWFAQPRQNNGVRFASF